MACFVPGRLAMKREADGDMGSPQKRSRRGDEEVRLLIPSKVSSKRTNEWQLMMDALRRLVFAQIPKLFKI